MKFVERCLGCGALITPGLSQVRFRGGQIEVWHAACWEQRRHLAKLPRRVKTAKQKVAQATIYDYLEEQR